MQMQNADAEAKCRCKMQTQMHMHMQMQKQNADADEIRVQRLRSGKFLAQKEILPSSWPGITMIGTVVNSTCTVQIPFNVHMK